MSKMQREFLWFVSILVAFLAFSTRAIILWSISEFPAEIEKFNFLVPATSSVQVLVFNFKDFQLQQVTDCLVL